MSGVLGARTSRRASGRADGNGRQNECRFESFAGGPWSQKPAMAMESFRALPSSYRAALYDAACAASSCSPCFSRSCSPARRPLPRSCSPTTRAADPLRRPRRGRGPRVVCGAPARRPARRRDRRGPRGHRLLGRAAPDLRQRRGRLLLPQRDGRPGRAGRRQRAHRRARVRPPPRPLDARGRRARAERDAGLVARPRHGASSSGSGASRRATSSAGTGASPRSSRRTTRSSRSGRRRLQRSRGSRRPTRP